MGALTSLPVSGDDLVQLAGLSADLEEPVEMTPKRPPALENSVGSSARVNCHRGVLGVERAHQNSGVKFCFFTLSTFRFTSLCDCS